MRALKPILRVLALAAAAAIVLFLVFQRRLLYFPTKTPEAEAVAAAARLGLAPWRAPDGTFRGWRQADSARFRALGAASGGPQSTPHGGAVVVLHGNAGTALDREAYVRALSPFGAEVVLLEYPGYGPRSGSPSGAALAEAAVEAVDALKAEGRAVWLVGESLGSGVVGRVVVERPGVVRGVVLIVPFADLGAVAKHHYPFVPAALVWDRFVPAKDLREFQGPAVVVVAGRDEILTAAEGRRLHDALPGPKRLVEQREATHNAIDLPPGSPFWRETAEFLGIGR